MAFSASPLLLAILLGVLSISASARPCKTFLVSSYSFTFPNPNEQSTSAGFVTVFAEIRQFNPRPSDLIIFPSRLEEPQIQRPPKLSYDFNSLRDRTKDILSVVVALLFGVGCGALTAATMYLVWSLFSARSDYSNSFDDESDSDDQFSPKKIGYVKIPADAAPAPAEKEAA
ncbi:hypothetical protein SLEP1_g30482 [Rubroshorea leprosula]|uniref:Uncharacterized protein n=1 Tax=Rubroshorea leprosula TaxID=152421 RepID=A0AAV5K8R6_9ROSI|nr:hypothetical protein SLEP1_g30482 [Rubroshorea leprosula]